MIIIKHGRMYGSQDFVKTMLPFTCEKCGCIYHEMEDRCEYHRQSGEYSCICPECDCVNMQDILENH